MKFHGLNYYSKQPQVLFDFYKSLGFRVHQEKESDDYFGAALSLTDEEEPLMWIWSIPEGQEQNCCNNLYFTTNGEVYEIYENIKAAGIDCPEPIKTFWGGVELIVTDPDGNTILYI
ncbi:MAG: VOC family protein [Clostridia bacterium]|nr:VOC family protein [Clostridia bacterium]